MGAPHEVLPEASAIALCGGIAVFYATNAIISLRFGRPLALVLRWAVPTLLLVAALAVAAAALPAEATIACAVVALAIIVAIAEVTARIER